MPRWCSLPILLALVLFIGCQKEEPLPPTAPPPEDLSTWTVPELVQPEHPLPEPIKPVKLPAGTSEKVYDFKPGVAVEVKVALGFPLDIVLEPGEQVRQIVDGDRGPAEQGQARRWEVHEGGDGSGDTLRPHVFVTASAPGLTNGLTITTTRRIYYITCKSVNRSPTRVLRWHYPDHGPGATPVPVVQKAPPLLPAPDQPIQYHTGYQLTVSQPPPAWVPRAVVDDGKKVYIVYPEVTLFENVPLVRIIGPNGPRVIAS